MKKICIDTHVIAWGIRSKRFITPDGLDKIKITKDLIKFFDNSKYAIYLPSCALAEALIPLKPESREEFSRKIQSSFIVSDFIGDAIVKYPELWNSYFKKPSGKPGLRQKMKIDFLILATALSRGCDLLVTNDRHLLKVGKHVIETKKIEDVKTFFQDQQKLDL